MKKLFVLLMVALFLLGTATAAFAVNFNDTVDGYTYSYSATDLNSTLVDLDSDNDNGIGNFNETGVGVGGQEINTDVILSKDMRDTATDATANNQRTHGSYQNNTNSCASCHQTHTAAAKNLLFKNSVYNTCTACHDGTLGFYNVFANGAMASTAGTFGGTVAGNASVHLATGTIDHKAAPGGNPSGTESTSWGEKFDCASCHAPHGSYSDRLLHYNPNNMANLASTSGGQKAVDAVVYDAYPAATSSTPALLYWRTTGAGLAASGLSGATSNAAAGAAYADDTVIVLLKKTTASPWSYSVDNTPWLYGYDFYTKTNKSRVKMYWSHFRTSATSSGSDAAADARIQPDDNAHYMWGQAFAYGSDFTAATYGDSARVYKVKLTDAAYPTTLVQDFGGIPIIKLNTGAFVTGGRGITISAWCGACHTDYNAKSGALTGMFGAQSYRHTTNSDSYACLRCHFAHGTDVEVMSDAKDQTLASLGGTADAKAYLLDTNPSSALKRYTNMAVCWKCHTDSKATQLKNNDYFWSNYDSVPHGF